jgi:nicotinate phosphoribosyltransferase
LLIAWIGLQKLRLTSAEREFLEEKCPFLDKDYLDYLGSLRLNPAEQVKISFQATSPDSEHGDIKLSVAGLWLETILYEIPLLALTSEAYFKFVDRDWDYDRQEGMSV